MDRCPNCGSSVRVGAKFCTTCGFRLPVETPPAEPTAPTRSPFDITSSTSSSRWPTPTPAEAPAPEPPPIPVTAELVEAANSDNPATFSGWPAYSGDQGAQSGWTDPAEEPAPADLSGASDIKSVEEAIFAWGGTDKTESAEENAPEPVVEDTPKNDDSADWFASIQADNTEIPVEELPEFETAEPEAASDDFASLQEILEPAPDAAVVDQVAEEVAAVEASPAVLASGGSSDPAARAAALVSELQALLPQLGNSGGGSSVDTSGIAQTLSAAREISDDDRATLQSLRAAVATAQARPRDVDVMLDLVSRASAMAALFEAHDKLATAIDKVIPALKGETQSEPEPRW